MGSKGASPYRSKEDPAGSIYDKTRRTGVITIPDQTPAPSPWLPQEFERRLGELLWRAAVIDAGAAARYFWLDVPDEPDLRVRTQARMGHPPHRRRHNRHSRGYPSPVREDERHLRGPDRRGGNRQPL